MAIKYECDRCKEVFNSTHYVEKIELPTINKSGFEHDTYRKDICLDCAKEITQFVMSKPGITDGRT